MDLTSHNLQELYVRSKRSQFVGQRIELPPASSKGVRRQEPDCLTICPVVGAPCGARTKRKISPKPGDKIQIAVKSSQQCWSLPFRQQSISARAALPLRFGSCFSTVDSSSVDKNPISPPMDKPQWIQTHSGRSKLAPSKYINPSYPSEKHYKLHSLEPPSVGGGAVIFCLWIMDKQGAQCEASFIIQYVHMISYEFGDWTEPPHPTPPQSRDCRRSKASLQEANGTSQVNHLEHIEGYFGSRKLSFVHSMCTFNGAMIDSSLIHMAGLFPADDAQSFAVNVKHGVQRALVREQCCVSPNLTS
ncbi:hypothetical protein Q8A73_010322 [Channa argus]|nr:hypothetical protein Q8A73_010322 [Channa argus]